MDVNIVTLPPARIAYMRHIGPYGAGINRFWAETFLPWRIAQGLDQSPCYGIGHDDPHITAPEQCRYDACVEVPEDFVVLLKQRPRAEAFYATLSRSARYTIAYQLHAARKPETRERRVAKYLATLEAGQKP